MTTPAPILPEPEPEPEQPLSDLDLYTMAVDFLDALLTVVHKEETIPYTSRYDRARTALETAAASADSWPQCASRAARKLQVDTPDEWLSQAVVRIGKHLGDRSVYRRWARLAERDALYITAVTRERRTTRRSDKHVKSDKGSAKPNSTSDSTRPASKENQSECLPF